MTAVLAAGVWPMPAIPGAWIWFPAFLIAVLGGARLTRLIVHDSYPPAVAVRTWWVHLTWDDTNNKEGRWGLLATCHWCAAPYVFALVIGSAWATHLHWGWWLFWGWLAGAYLAAIVVEHDEKD